MKIQIWLFFLVFSSAQITYGQIVYDFSSASDLSNSVWKGDIESFILDNGELRLSAAQAGQSVIWHAVDYHAAVFFSIDARLEFSPSTKNNVEIYLWSAAQSLDSEALFFRVGESGSQDNVELYWRSEDGTTKLGEGRMGAMGVAPAQVRILAEIEGNRLSIRAVYDEGAIETPEIVADLPSVLGSKGFMGIACNYTSTRADRFYFDNLYVGDPMPDQESPAIKNVNASEHQVVLEFSESVDENATDRLSYELSSSGDMTSPSSIIASQYSQRVALSFDDVTFSPGESYALMVSVSDLSGNPLDTTINFIIPEPIEIGDLLINEVLFNPKGNGSDYIEVINVSDKIIGISGLSIANRDKNEEALITLPSSIPPGEIIVWTDDPQDILSRYPNAEVDQIFKSKIPALSNSDGNVTLLLDGNIIDSYDYSDDAHHPLLNDEDGISLERIAYDQRTDDPENWTSSIAQSGGTPGMSNSVTGGMGGERIYFELDKTTFSPDGDGFDDELLLSYELPHSSYIATASVYNDYGQRIVTIQDNAPLLQSGSLAWDGRDANGRIAPAGIYIMVVDGYSLKADRFLKRLSCVLARSLND